MKKFPNYSKIAKEIFKKSIVKKFMNMVQYCIIIIFIRLFLRHIFRIRIN